MVAKTTKPITNFMNTSAMTRPFFMLGAAAALLGVGPAAAGGLNPNTLPGGGTVVGGQSTISQSGNTMDIDQTSSRTVIDWRSFNIGSSAKVDFNQPNSSSIAVNRVNGSANPSDIEGSLHANGQVWILNPNGVFFGKTARVDAAGIVATTANINNQKFMAGNTRLHMSGADHGSVVNEGHITVGSRGLAAFVAPSVRNSGTIKARLGKVTLAAGTTYTLDLAGDHLVELGLGSVKAVVDDTGRIVNPGGTVTLTAKAASNVVDSVVNVSGIIDASSAKREGGDIILGADDVTTTSSAVLSANAGTHGDGGTIKLVALKEGNYDGAFSAKGGSKKGNGGEIETSGKNVTIARAFKVNTSAHHGVAGTWLLDPVDMTIVSGSSDDSTGTITGSTVTNGTIQDALNNDDNIVLTTSGSGGSGDITLDTAINASGTGNLTLTGAHLYSANTSTDVINIDGTLTLNVNSVNNTTSPGASWLGDALAMIGNVSGGTTVDLGAGTYAGGVTISDNNVTLDGSTGAVVTALTNGTDAIHIAGNSDTVENLEIAGPADTSYLTYDWGSAVTRGISVAQNVTGFTIKNDNIHGLRTDILVDGRDSTGTIKNNTIDNSKSGISIQYTDGTGIAITGNSQGQFGNEWGENLHLNGVFDGTNTNSNPGGAAPSGVQQALLADSAANGGWTVQDQEYSSSNRTAVTVATTGSDGNQGSQLSPLASIQAGINAVVSGGEVDVDNGTYVISSGYINVDKSLTLEGQSEDGVIIDARNASTYGLRVSGPNSDVTLEDFTLYGVTAVGGYGLKAEDTTNLTLTDITSQGAYKSEFDLNGIVGGTLDGLTANGYTVGTTTETGGNGISFTDSQNITLTNSTTMHNAWGGLALYQGTTYGSLQETGIVVNGTNTFNEANGIYAQDQSSVAFGTINITGQGIQYIATDVTGNSDGTYTWFQTTKSGALAIAEGSETLSGATVQGYAAGSVDGNNTFYVGTNGVDAMSIQTAVDAASSGATINVLPGTYTGAITIDKANLTLESTGGAADTTIDAGGAAKAVTISTDAGLGTITVDGFTVKDWTSGGIIEGYGGWSANTAAVNVTNNIVDGPDTGATANGNGIEVSGNDSVVSGNTVNNVHLNSTVWSGSGIIVVDGSDITIENNTVNGADNGIAVTDWDNPAGMSGIKITGNTISHSGADEGDGISIEAFEGEYFGTPSGPITGLTITNNTVTDSYSGLGIWDYSPSLRGTWAGTITELSGNTFTNNTTQISTNFTGADLAPFLTTNTFDAAVYTVGGDEIISDLQAAIDGASAGATLDVEGTFNENISDGAQLSFNFDDVTVKSFTLGTGGAGSSLSGDLTATGAITLNGASQLSGDFTAATISLNGAATLIGDTSLDATGALIVASVDGSGKGGQDLTLQGSSVSLGDVGDSKSLGAVTDTSDTTLTGSSYDAASFDFGSLILANDTSITATGAITIGSVDGTNAGKQDLTLQGSSVSLGDVGDGKSLGALTDTSATTLTGSTYDAASFDFGALTLTNDTTLDATGAITIGSVDGTNAGAQDLTLQGSSVNLGNVGAKTSLGALNDDAVTTLTGSTYDASSIDFADDITLTADTTTFDTTQSSNAPGDITVGGNIFGTADGKQSLVLIAGSGDGSSANGNISLQNAGTASMELGNLTVSGNNFTALTVDLAGNFTSSLAGNQVFAADTLNAGGDVNSTVGGDASGHIVAGGDVNLDAGGAASGDISGQNVTITADTVNATVDAVDKAVIQAQTIEGSYSADDVSLTASQDVNATIEANTLNVNSPRGSVNGTWTTLDATGGGTIVANGQPVLENYSVNGQQLVVEGFVLPAGSVISANGQLVLPQGMVLGLLSPGGDSKPKLILVHSVQELGSLLESGYVAIVIDLSGHKKDDKIQLASN